MSLFFVRGDSLREIDSPIALRSRPVAIHHITRHLVRLTVFDYVHPLLVMPIFKFRLESRYVFHQKFVIVRGLQVFVDLREIFIIRRNGKTPKSFSRGRSLIDEI